MNWEINPFQELYLSDSVSEEAFVELFSPVPLTSAINPLFQEGNVVLSGTQGSGKSMILRLLFPETRIAFFEKDIPFPVETRASRFISAGVNLVKSGICDLGQVTLGKGDDFDVKWLPNFFGDFFNMLVIQDLLKNIRIINGREDVFGGIVDLECDEQFTKCLASQDCWFGLLSDCSDLRGIEEKISKRIEIYRRWVSNPDVAAPSEVVSTKTAIGEPIARVVECLKNVGMLADDVLVFVRVDQLEELHQEAGNHQKSVRMGFRQILNRAFASRDLRLHYRIGTRRYGWNQPDQLTVHGSGARLEARRDYLWVDLEEVLIRKENRKAWQFPNFARDAFRRRLKWALDLPELPDDLLFNKVFGKHPSPFERAQKFSHANPSTDQIDRILRLNPNEGWPEEWRKWAHDLAADSPLEGVLAAAWVRQKIAKGSIVFGKDAPPKDSTWMKKWWRKERLMLAVLQLAARRAQRLLWWGTDDILALSTPNITAFLHLCHGIWDLLLKEENLKDDLLKRINPLDGDMIPVDTQAGGIQSSSRQWYDKLSEQPGGDLRCRFIENLGKKFRAQLRDDASMSYPGANGFSLRRDQLEFPKNRELWRFLADAVGYGDLVATEHTTKNKQGEARVKFYINPLLSPVFQIPAAHTKEPLYWDASIVMEVACASGLPFAMRKQSGLLDGEDESDTRSQGGKTVRPGDGYQLNLF